MMIQVREFLRAIRLMFILWAITAIAYPVIILAVGQVAFPFQANGSLLKNEQGQIIGSVLIGQPFRGERYFWSRPSAVNYSTDNITSPTGVSGASNLAPTNPKLLENIHKEIDRLKLSGIKPTADLLYSSGSGLDPHLSLAAAKNQIPRIAQTRDLDSNQVELLITKYTEGRFLGIFGEPVVNLFQLNLALDKLNSPLRVLAPLREIKPTIDSNSIEYDQSSATRPT